MHPGCGNRARSGGAGAELMRVLRRVLLGTALLSAAVPALGQDAEAPAPLRVYAAGSLTGAFNALLAAFGTPPGTASTR